MLSVIYTISPSDSDIISSDAFSIHRWPVCSLIFDSVSEAEASSQNSEAAVAPSRVSLSFLSAHTEHLQAAAASAAAVARDSPPVAHCLSGPSRIQLHAARVAALSPRRELAHFRRRACSRKSHLRAAEPLETQLGAILHTRVDRRRRRRSRATRFHPIPSHSIRP